MPYHQMNNRNTWYSRHYYVKNLWEYSLCEMSFTGFILQS